MSTPYKPPLDLSRLHTDPLAQGVPPLFVDRQRIVQAAAFRRLQHKTQVFVLPESDHFRTRLTHTLEVAHQARGLATHLGLNGDLAEVVALAHDLGHPPFGHAGEQALNACLAEQGGFEHNQHTLRIVEELEHPYPGFLGLNLTHAVRTCLASHSTQYDRPGAHPLQDGPPPPAESRVVDVADRLAYALHDLQDGLYAGLLEPRRLVEVTLWQAAYDGPDLAVADAWRGHLRPTVDRIQAAIWAGVQLSGHAVTISPACDAQLGQLDRFLYEHLYRSAALRAADEHAREILAAVFRWLLARPAALPDRFRRRLANQPAWRVVTDYVAGMTDRFCLQEHAHLADAPPP